MVLAIAGNTSCSSGGANALMTSPTRDAQVTVVLTSTANDQLLQFDLKFKALGLTSQSGKTVNLLAVQQPSEFIHLNAAIDPLVTTAVPGDVYTSATATIAYGTFVCVANGLVGGQPALSFAYYNNKAESSVTVTLPSAITVTGNSMILALIFMVSNSAAAPDCLNPNGFAGFSMTPTFNLSPLVLASTPTSPANGKLSGLEGRSGLQTQTIGRAATTPVPRCKLLRVNRLEVFLANPCLADFGICAGLCGGSSLSGTG